MKILIPLTSAKAPCQCGPGNIEFGEEKAREAHNRQTYEKTAATLALRTLLKVCFGPWRGMYAKLGRDTLAAPNSEKMTARCGHEQLSAWRSAGHSLDLTCITAIKIGDPTESFDVVNNALKFWPANEKKGL